MSRPVRLILDTSAIVAYAHGSEPVGETIREVHLDQAAPWIGLTGEQRKPGEG